MWEVGSNSGDDEDLVDSVATHLTERFPDLPPETIAQVVRQTHQQFADQPIKTFVPLLVENLAGHQLRHMRKDDNPPHTDSDQEADDEASGEVGGEAVTDSTHEPDQTTTQTTT